MIRLWLHRLACLVLDLCDICEQRAPDHMRTCARWVMPEWQMKSEFARRMGWSGNDGAFH